MEEKRTGLFENGLIWFGAGGFRSPDPDRNISGSAWHGEKDWRQSY